ncbi:glycosyltransferase family 2 protein [Candidatus Roizmanbacteria bacterium]|nr:glycosyltransferase family 2 protein [Candidatus Roizmanbacteria bacterium]
MKKILSIVLPTYNEEANIEYAYREIKKMLASIPKYDYEIIFVDNYSLDRSRELIKKMAQKDKKVSAIFLSRNFTSEYSSHAAMKHSIGDILTIVDCDLQDHPSVIPKFIKKWEQGYQVIVGVRNVTNDTYLMRTIRKLFYIILKKLANIDMPLNAGTFCLLDRRVLNVIINLPEKNRFFRGLRAWSGFQTSYVEYERRERKYGTTKNNLFDYLRDAQRGLLGFSFVPLDIMTSLGFILVLFSFLFLLGYLFVVFLFGNPIRAQIPLLLAIVFFGGMQMLTISIVGKYVQIIFEEVKGRPPYIIENILNDHRNKKLARIYK